jgi:2-oxoglutarate ferredoxin oxidoreductase subunit beta
VAYLISQMEYPAFPVPVGVFLDIQRETYEELLVGQVKRAQAKPGAADLQQLLRGGQTWRVD